MPVFCEAAGENEEVNPISKTLLSKQNYEQGSK
jgi:hypothetical protein